MVAKGPEMISKKLGIALAIIALISVIWGSSQTFAIIYRIEPIEVKVKYNTDRLDRLFEEWHKHSEAQKECIARLETTVNNLVKEIDKEMNTEKFGRRK